MALVLGNCGHDLPWGRVAAPGGLLANPSPPGRSGLDSSHACPHHIPPTVLTAVLSAQAKGPGEDLGPDGR